MSSPRPPRFLLPLVSLCALFLILSARRDAVDLIPDAKTVDEAQLSPSPVHSRQHGFIENRGQWERRFKYGLWTGGVATAIADDGWLVGRNDGDEHQGWAVGFAFEGLSESTRLSGTQRSSAKVSYFRQGQRFHDVRTFQQLRYDGLYEGVDARLLIDDGNLRYDLLLDAGADLGLAVMRVDGGQGLSIDENGALRIATPKGPLIQTPPVAWQVDTAGRQVPVDCRFRIIDQQRFGFEAPMLDPAFPLTVDPGIVWSLRAGAFSGNDSATAMCVAPYGDVFIAGDAPADFPTIPGAYQVGTGGAFISRISSDGTTLLGSTFIGDASTEIRALAVDGPELVAAGFTNAGFPTTAGAFAATNSGSSDGLVVRFSDNLQTLNAATYLGGAGPDEIHDMDLGPGGDVYVCGFCYSTSYPTTMNAATAGFVGGYEATVAVLSSGLDQLIYGTLLGGLNDDAARGIACDDAGVATIAGFTASTDFPATAGSAYPTSNPGNGSAWVARIDPAGATSALSFIYCTYLGGSGFDDAEDVGIRPDGSAVVVGRTASIDFPATAGTHAPTHGGPPPVGLAPAGFDGFVSVLSPDGSSLVHGTFVGGTSDDWIRKVELDPSGLVHIAGITGSSDFPVTPGALATAPASPSDAFAARLSPDLDQLLYGTFVGGGSTDDLIGMGLASNGDVVVYGETGSPNYPVTPGTATTPFNGGCVIVFGLPLPCSDIFLTRLDMLPNGTDRLGTASGNSNVNPRITVGGTIQSPGPDARLVLSAGAPWGQGVLGIGAPGPSGGTAIAGLSIYLDLATYYIEIPITADGAGYAEIPLSIPAGLTGATFVSQAVWPTSATWGGLAAGSFAATPALLTVLP